MTNADTPGQRNAQLDVLVPGYIHTEGKRVGSTVTLISEEDVRIVVDPGMVADRDVILDPLEQAGVAPTDITDVVFSHHHPDHTVNAALFPKARIHDHWAIYQDDLWTSRDAEGCALSPSVRLIETPGHTPQDITTLVGTSEGVIALTHLWWRDGYPEEDPYATDPDALHAGRRRVLAIEDLALIVPGHGEPFRPSETTPR